MAPGQVQSTGKIHFRPDGVKFLKFGTANVGIRALICPTCGTIELVGDVEKLGKITS